jgi:transposase-like protein
MHAARTKAAVMAALLAGETARGAARRFGISRTTVRRWRREAWACAQNGPEKRELGAQLLEYLGEGLETRRVQLQAMGDPAWLKQQSARDLAMLYGVVFDQMVRLLTRRQQTAVQEE